MVGGGKLTATQCNFTHQDQIWRDYVYKEGVISKKWTKTWGFLAEEYDAMQKDVTRIKQRSPNKKSPPLKLPPLKAPKQDTSNPFPVLTSKEIGWRSGRRECNLEVYGRWGRPKYSIINQLRWPDDAVP